MLNKIKNFLFKVRYYKYLNINDTVNQKNLEYQYSVDNNEKKLFEYGFSTYSQHEEDGMLLYIFSLIGTTDKKCVEMCVGTGIESNTANLIINHFWAGLLFDGNSKNIKIAQNFYSKHKNTMIYPPRVVHAWIDKENINSLIADNGYRGEIDLFSLDIDGIDYYLLENLNVITPRVIVLEINHLLGYERSCTVPYDKSFQAEFSSDGSDYAGASLMAFIKLAKKKGYRFVGTNRFATNAFFIRDDIKHQKLDEVKDVSLYFKHPRVVYGMTKRYKRIKDKAWIEV